MIVPDNDDRATTRRATGQRGRWHKPRRCSICTRFTWFRPVALKEPDGTPEPRRAWVICKRCHDALLVELLRSSNFSPMRLRIAMGLVAAERSPRAYKQRTPDREFQREFAWFTWAIFLFFLLHLAILAIVWAAPK